MIWWSLDGEMAASGQESRNQSLIPKSSGFQ